MESILRKTVKGKKIMKNSANKFRARRVTKFRVKDILYFYKIKNRFIWLFECKVERQLY